MPAPNNPPLPSATMLPPEVSATTGTWIGRAHNYEIFTSAWFGYRSLALVSAATAIFALLLALALMPIRFRSLGPLELTDSLSLVWSYLVPVVVLIVAGPGLAVWARKTGWGRRHELLAINLALAAGILCSVGTEWLHSRIYQRRHVDPASGLEIVRTTPVLLVRVEIAPGRTTYFGEPKALSPDFNGEIGAAIREVRAAFRKGDLAPLNIDFTEEELRMSSRAMEGESMSQHEHEAITRAATSITRKAGLATLAAAQRFIAQQVDSPQPGGQARAVERLNRLLHEPAGLPLSSRISALSRGIDAFAMLALAALALYLVLWLSGYLDLLSFLRQRGPLENVLQKRELEQAQAARAAAETRLSVLAAQVEPHFLFNSLAGVRSAAVSDPARATHMIDQLVSYLRSTIPQMRSDAGSVTVRLATQMDSVRSYLALMHERIPRMSFSVETGEGLDDALLPPLMLISLVENAIKHGVEYKIGPAHIEVGATRTAAGELEVAVRDDGVGFGDATTGGGIGLSNIQERLRTQFGQSAALTLKALPGGGVAAILRLPLSFES